MKTMPDGSVVERGRGFDSYDNIMWTQRVVKEENAVLGADVAKEQKKRANKSEKAIRRLEDKMLGTGSAMKDSVTSCMYRSDGLPEEFRALNRWPVNDACLITCHPKVRGDGLEPKLRFNSQYVDAMWVPGKTGQCGKYIQHRPEFYFEDVQAKKQLALHRWPAAGEKSPKQLFGEPPLPTWMTSSPLTACQAPPSAAASMAAGAASAGAVATSAGKTGALLPTGAVASSSSMPVMPRAAAPTVPGAAASKASGFQFQIGAPGAGGAITQANRVQPQPIGRSRSSTLVVAGDSTVPRRQIVARQGTPPGGRIKSVKCPPRRNYAGICEASRPIRVMRPIGGIEGN